MRRAGIAAPVLGFALAAAAVAGCSNGGGLAAHPPSGTSRPSSPVGTSAPAWLPTGPELAKLLPPHTALPPGWTVGRGPSSTRNLTSKFSKPLAELGPAAKDFNTCVEVNIGAGGSNLMALWDMSWAYAEASPPHFPALSAPALVQIADFLPGGAVKQLAWDRMLATRCHHYRDPTDHSPVTVTATPVHGLGDQALYLQIVNPYNFGGQLIRARASTLLVRAGSDMIAVSQGGTTSDPANKAIPFARLRQLAEQYLGPVAHLRGNSS